MPASLYGHRLDLSSQQIGIDGQPADPKRPGERFALHRRSQTPGIEMQPGTTPWHGLSMIDPHHRTTVVGANGQPNEFGGRATLSTTDARTHRRNLAVGRRITVDHRKVYRPGQGRRQCHPSRRVLGQLAPAVDAT
jgi:hypothetical protein